MHQWCPALHQHHQYPHHWVCQCACLPHIWLQSVDWWLRPFLVLPYPSKRLLSVHFRSCRPATRPISLISIVRKRRFFLLVILYSRRELVLVSCLSWKSKKNDHDIPQSVSLTSSFKPETLQLEHHLPQIVKSIFSNSAIKRDHRIMWTDFYYVHSAWHTLCANVIDYPLVLTISTILHEPLPSLANLFPPPTSPFDVTLERQLSPVLRSFLLRFSRRPKWHTKNAVRLSWQIRRDARLSFLNASLRSLQIF